MRQEDHDADPANLIAEGGTGGVDRRQAVRQCWYRRRIALHRRHRRSCVICNNAAERAIRPLALGRKNWMFDGADSGGERAAVIETAKLNGLDPEAYLHSLIVRIADHPAKHIDVLLPWNVRL